MSLPEDFAVVNELLHRHLEMLSHNNKNDLAPFYT